MGAGAIAAIAMQAVGTGVSAYGQYQAGAAEESAARYNARVLQREAQAREQKSLLESKQQAEEANRLQSTMRARLGASGAVTTEGAPLAALAEQARQSELENLLIGYGGQTEAQQLRSQARQTRYAGKIAGQAGSLQSMTTLLSGFGGMGMDYINRKK